MKTFKDLQVNESANTAEEGIKTFSQLIESEIDIEFEDEDKIANSVHNFMNEIERKFGKKGKKLALQKLKDEK